MSNAQKIRNKSESKKTREPRQKKVKINLELLTDAIVDGKLTVPVKGRVVFVRTFGGTRFTHEGHVFGYDETTGDVSIWDETRQQFWGFNAVKDANQVVCKSLSAAPVDPGTT